MSQRIAYALAHEWIQTARITMDDWKSGLTAEQLAEVNRTLDTITDKLYQSDS